MTATDARNILAKVAAYRAAKEEQARADTRLLELLEEQRQVEDQATDAKFKLAVAHSDLFAAIHASAP